MRIALLLLVAACSSGRAKTDGTAAATQQAAPEDPRRRCCEQCTAAASRDPTGADISGKTCTTYPAEWNGGPGIDDECRAWFAAQPVPLAVGDCRR
jgi:hypothetical protein